MSALILPPALYIPAHVAKPVDQRLAHWHRVASRLLGLRHPVRFEVGQVPKKFLAVTSRDGDSCRLVYRHNAVPLRVILHEMCHCYQDFNVLDGNGWAVGILMDEEQIPKRERAAETCAGNLERRLR